MINVFYYDFSFKHVILIITMITLFGFIFYAAFNMYMFFEENSIITRAVKGAYTRLNEKNKEREKKKVIERISVGNKKDNSILSVIDRAITYSGIQNKIKWLKTEVIVTITLLICIAMFTVMFALSKSAFNGTVACIALCIFEYALLIAASHRRYIEVENGIMEFLGNVQNFSGVETDIIAIFDKAANYTNEPIRTNVRRCVTEARHSGNTMQALNKLEDSIENDYFKLAIRNLSVCSRHSCNYSEVIEELKVLISDYVAFEKQKREKYKALRIEVIVLVVLVVFCLYKMVGFYENGIMGFIGGNRAIILYIGIVVAVIELYKTAIKPMMH